MGSKMIKEESKKEVENFLKWHRDPLVRVAARNMKDGYVACIDPIPNVCGPELMCSPSTRKHLMKMLGIPRSKLVPPEYWELPPEECWSCGKEHTTAEPFVCIGEGRLNCMDCWQKGGGEEDEDS